MAPRPRARQPAPSPVLSSQNRFRIQKAYARVMSSNPQGGAGNVQNLSVYNPTGTKTAAVAPSADKPPKLPAPRLKSQTQNDPHRKCPYRQNKEKRKDETCDGTFKTNEEFYNHMWMKHGENWNTESSGSSAATRMLRSR